MGAVNFDQRERELFNKQGAQGINFDSYSKIEVECKGPGADTIPGLQSFKDLGAQVLAHLPPAARLLHHCSERVLTYCVVCPAAASVLPRP
jgi:hypothetical protein